MKELLDCKQRSQVEEAQRCKFKAAKGRRGLDVTVVIGRLYAMDKTSGTRIGGLCHPQANRQGMSGTPPHQIRRGSGLNVKAG
jgi:hypothetical protein